MVLVFKEVTVLLGERSTRICLQSIVCGSGNVVPGPAVSGILLEMQILVPHRRPTGCGLSNLPPFSTSHDYEPTRVGEQVV